jgi:hypothetical protein
VPLWFLPANRNIREKRPVLNRVGKISGFAAGSADQNEIKKVHFDNSFKANSPQVFIFDRKTFVIAIDGKSARVF